MKIGFDHGKYLEEQSKYILERVNKHDKLYIEFGGKLLGDLHAKRVLPGFCVYAGDIERNKIRGDFGITYDMDVFRLIDDLRENELKVNSVVITRYEDRPSTDLFITRLERRGIKVYKLATCLSQLYHEYKRGKNVGYSKFETFPVWNVPLKHPLNIAYEAATVDLNDVNMIDPFHLEEYGEIAVNYNRDIEAFPLLKRIIEKITGKKSIYQSPTDMGVNRVGFGITDDEVVREASLKEEDRKVVTFARKKLELLNNEEKSDKQKTLSAIAFEMPDGQIITGKKSSLMDAPSAAILNSLKYLSNFDDELLLISPTILEPIIKLKEKTLKNKHIPLDCEEILIALSITAATNPMAELALSKLSQLAGVQAHSTHILGRNDEQSLRKLGIDVTSDQVFPTENLYYNQ